MKFRKISPFCGQMLESFPFIAEDFDQMTEYALYCKLKEKVDQIRIGVNDLGDDVAEYIAKFDALKNYVDNYFDNLDVQDEINNKLNEMAEDGTLQEIIGDYLDANALWCFDNVEDMKTATNLIDGSFAKTLGYYDANDGGESLYKIRAVTNQDVEDDCFIIPLNNTNLVAELIIKNNIINILQGGAKGDGSTNNSSIIQNIIDKIPENYAIFIPNGDFYCENELTLKNKITLKGEEVKQYNVQPTSKLLFNNHGIKGNYSYNLKNLNIIGNNKRANSIGIDSAKCSIESCNISNFGIGIYTPRTGVINNCHIYDNSIGISGAIDSRIINNFIYNQTGRAIDLYSGSNDNIISNNKIEWNGGEGVLAYQTAHNIISENIFDRNTLYGVTFNGCSNNNLNNNIFRRNYVSEGVSDIKSHIRIENSNNCNITNNMTIKGNSKDDGSGFIIPSTSIYITTSHDLNLTSNNFSGSVNKDVATYSNTGNIFRLDLNNQIIANLETIKTFFNIPANGNNTQEVTIDTPSDNGAPTFKKILIQARTTSNSNGYVKEIIINVFKQYNTNYVVSFDNNVFIDNAISLTGTYNATTGKATITFTNSSNSSFSARIRELAI